MCHFPSSSRAAKAPEITGSPQKRGRPGAGSSRPRLLGRSPEVPLPSPGGQPWPGTRSQGTPQPSAGDERHQRTLAGTPVSKAWGGAGHRGRRRTRHGGKEWRGASPRALGHRGPEGGREPGRGAERASWNILEAVESQEVQPGWGIVAGGSPRARAQDGRGRGGAVHTSRQVCCCGHSEPPEPPAGR